MCLLLPMLHTGKPLFGLEEVSEFSCDASADLVRDIQQGNDE